MQKLKAILVIIAALGSPTMALAASPAEKLAKLFRPHAYTGQQITKSMKATTGDPNITVLDRRFEFGEIYTCSFMFIKKRRVIVCD